ncbi:MAG TPA: DUF4185 domain-containing protein [Verrucomicrobiae bacterium]|jgi:hypothetical protein|nr:DUF4185 domain-containing protein [Verrucomicrobiae bacterium]
MVLGIPSIEWEPAVMFRTILAFAAMLTLAAFYAAAGDLSFRVSAAPEWNQMFQRTNGWLGADVAYSVPLSSDKTLWLFGDTFVGQIRDGKRESTKMIHSSVAEQPLGGEPQFYYPLDKKGQAQSFVKSLGPKTYFWLSDGARTKSGLYLFMQQVQWINNTAWGFQCVGTWLAKVENPDTPPGQWKKTTQKLPFTRLADGQAALLGSEILQSGDYIYIYGFSNYTNSTATKNQIVARAPENNPGDPAGWKFYSNGTWTRDFEKTTPIFSNAGAEGSVSWQPYLKKFVFVYSEGIWGTILMRTAEAPEGPWSNPVKLYQCPDMKFSPHAFCYAAKGHPELSTTNELIISYAANSESLSDVMNDTRLYWPRFIRVTFLER